MRLFLYRLGLALSSPLSSPKAWHATNYSNGRKRVYVTFEELKAM